MLKAVVLIILSIMSLFVFCSVRLAKETDEREIDN